MVLLVKKRAAPSSHSYVGCHMFASRGIDIEAAKKNGEWERASSIDERPDAAVPEDFKKALEKNKKAKKNFFNFAPSYRKQYIWWILSAKRDETRAKRIKETIEAAEQNRKPGLK